MKDNDDIHLYYWFDWTFYCYGDFLYVWDPCYWEEYNMDGWNWYWDGYNYSGFCMGYIDDTWYSWGYDMDWYTHNGDNFYCNNGN